MFLPIHWKARVKDYKFYNENYFNGIIISNLENLKDILINFHIRKEELIKKTGRLLFFTFPMKFLHNSGEVIIEIGK